jgi:hypothetical protein
MLEIKLDGKRKGFEGREGGRRAEALEVEGNQVVASEVKGEVQS